MNDKVCDNCGVLIPNSEHRSMSDVGTYWCDECEAAGGESLGDLMQRLADRATLGVEPRTDNPVFRLHFGAAEAGPDDPN